MYKGKYAKLLHSNFLKILFFSFVIALHVTFDYNVTNVIWTGHSP